MSFRVLLYIFYIYLYRMSSNIYSHVDNFFNNIKEQVFCIILQLVATRYIEKHHGDCPAHASTLIAKPNIHSYKLMLSIWWDQLGVVYYGLLQETITGYCYRLQLIYLSQTLKQKWFQYEQRHDKVILLHNNARPRVANPVKTFWKHRNGKFQSICRIHLILLHLTTTCSNYWFMT